MERISLEQAIERIKERIVPVCETLELELDQALGYILAEDIRAQISQPPFPRSPLDGYALRAADVQGASKDRPVTLRVIDKIMAGTVSKRMVERGTAVRLMTGAPIPVGADCVIRQEDTDYGETDVQIYRELRSQENICEEGEDFRKGDLLLEKGDRLDASVIGIAAGAGVTKVRVYRRPRVAVFCSGDELQEPGTALAEGKIYDSSLAFIRAQLKEWDVEITASGHFPDDPAVVGEAIDSAVGRADLILTTGGVSVGQKDIMHDVVRDLNGEQVFWRVAVKPGSPTLVFSYKGTIVICLTGNPYGTFANLELLAGPVISRLARDPAMLPEKRRGVAVNEFRRRSGIRRIVKARYEDGRVTIPDAKQQSGVLSGLRGMNCLVDIPAEQDGVCAGEEVTVWMIGRR